MQTITTNKRFDRLTNLDISTHYRDEEYWFMLSDFLAAFAYWAVAQNPNKVLIAIDPALRAFKEYISVRFKNDRMPTKFTYQELEDIINEKTLAAISEILELNELKPDFIDFSALAKNIFFMILREQITQRL